MTEEMSAFLDDMIRNFDAVNISNANELQMFHRMPTKDSFPLFLYTDGKMNLENKTPDPITGGGHYCDIELWDWSYIINVTYDDHNTNCTLQDYQHYAFNLIISSAITTYGKLSPSEVDKLEREILGKRRTLENQLIRYVNAKNND